MRLPLSLWMSSSLEMLALPLSLLLGSRSRGRWEAILSTRRLPAPVGQKNPSPMESDIQVASLTHKLEYAKDKNDSRCSLHLLLERANTHAATLTELQQAVSKG